jgi:hypothetical protein
MTHILPVEVALRDIDGYGEMTREPRFVLWADAIRSALKERDTEIEKLRADVTGLIRLHGRQDFEHRQKVERLEGKLEDCREALREHMGIINDERRKSVHLLMSGSQALGSSLDEIERLKKVLQETLPYVESAMALPMGNEAWGRADALVHKVRATLTPEDKP